MKIMIKILCLVGESGSGKSTIAESLSKDDKYNYVQSYTTRKSRAVNEVGHIFADELVYKKHKELDADANNPLKIIAETYFSNNYYWTVNTQFLKDKVNIYVVDPKGVDDLRKLKQFNTLVIYLKVDTEIRKQRMIERTLLKNKFSDLDIAANEANNRIYNDNFAFEVVPCDYTMNANITSEIALGEIKKIMEGWI